MISSRSTDREVFAANKKLIVKNLALLLLLWLVPMPALGQEAEPTCPDGIVCVEEDDFQKFLQLAKEQQCRNTNVPTVETDSINIIVDKEGRVYGSGTGDYPFTIRMDWCNYKLEAKSQVKLQVAQRVEDTWGFRLRIKATFGFLLSEIFRDSTDEVQDTLDGGLLVEPFYLDWANFNLYVGVRSVGAGLGADLTTNFGVYAGYALTWGEWQHSPLVSIYFAF